MSMTSIEAAKKAQDLYYLKQQAVKYYNDNGLPQKMEEILNSMFYDNPTDVYGHVANFFETFALQPTITKIVASEGYDSKGQPANTVEVFARIKNNEELVASVTTPSGTTLADSARSDEKDEDDACRRDEQTCALQLLNDELEPQLRDQELLQDVLDVKIDALIAEVRRREEEAKAEADANEAETASPQSQEKPTSAKKAKSPAKNKGGKGAAVVIVPDEPSELLPRGFSAASAASAALCAAAAACQQVQPWQHVLQLRHKEIPDKVAMPLPIATILQNGKAYPGKLQFIKEVMIFPRKNMASSAAMKHIQSVYERIANNLVAKSGGKRGVSVGKGAPPPLMARLGTDSGALCPALDRAEQALDMVQEALAALELTAGTDFFFALSCAGKEMFDYEKGKYDVLVGGAKSPEDTVEMYADLISRYPIKMIIDPIRKEDKEAWMTLCERVSDQCLVVGDEAHARAQVLANQELTPEWQTSGAVLRLEGLNTVSHMLFAVERLKQENQRAVVVSTSSGESPDTLIVDVAVGMEADMLLIGAPVRGERINKWLRLLAVERQLEREGSLAERTDLHMPHIEKPPAPEPEEEVKDAKEEPKAKR